MSAKNAASLGMGLGLAFAAALFIGVLATGQTFGQRCSALGLHGDAHAKCVEALAMGLEVNARPS